MGKFQGASVIAAVAAYLYPTIVHHRGVWYGCVSLTAYYFINIVWMGAMVNGIINESEKVGHYPTNPSYSLLRSVLIKFRMILLGGVKWAIGRKSNRKQYNVCLDVFSNFQKKIITIFLPK